MNFKEFLELSEQGMPPPMGGPPGMSGPPGMGGPPPGPPAGGGGMPNVASLWDELLPKGVLQSDKKLAKALKGGIVAPNFKFGPNAQDLAPLSVKQVNTNDGKVTNILFNLTPANKLKGSSTDQFIKHKNGKYYTIRGKAGKDKNVRVLANVDTLNKVYQPQKGGGPTGAANPGLPGMPGTTTM